MSGSVDLVTSSGSSGNGSSGNGSSGGHNHGHSLCDPTLGVRGGAAAPRLRVLVATRLHFNGRPDRVVDADKVMRFLSSVQSYDDTAVAIAFGGTDEQHRQLLRAVHGARPSFPVRVLRVCPWGRFTPALNALLQLAVHGHSQGGGEPLQPPATIDIKAEQPEAAAVSASWPPLPFHRVLYQSMEVAPDAGNVGASAAVQRLMDAVDPETLVAGVALPGHAFAPGEHAATGTTVPWNTFALWDARKLARLGFPSVADGLAALGPEGPGAVPGGVEEVATLSILQRLWPGDSAAKLLRLPALSAAWRTDFAGDPARLAAHREKMTSKVQRPAAQLEALGIAPGTVRHIDFDAL